MFLTINNNTKTFICTCCFRTICTSPRIFSREAIIYCGSITRSNTTKIRGWRLTLTIILSMRTSTTWISIRKTINCLGNICTSPCICRIICCYIRSCSRWTFLWCCWRLGWYCSSTCSSTRCSSINTPRTIPNLTSWTVTSYSSWTRSTSIRSISCCTRFRITSITRSRRRRCTNRWTGTTIHIIISFRTCYFISCTFFSTTTITISRIRNTTITITSTRTWC